MRLFTSTQSCIPLCRSCALAYLEPVPRRSLLICVPSPPCTKRNLLSIKSEMSASSELIVSSASPITSSPPFLTNSSIARVYLPVLSPACWTSFLCLQHKRMSESSSSSSSNVFDAGDVVDMVRRISLARVRLSFLMGFSQGLCCLVWPMQ